MSTPDYYRILGVAPYSEDVVIQAAYRALMRRYHPDTNSSPDALKRATEINEAYEILRDPDRKAKYDAERKESQAKARSRTSQSNQSPPPPPPPFPPGQSARAAEPVAPNPVPDDRRNKWIATAIIGGFLLVSGLITSGIISDRRSSAAENNMAVENLTAENLVVEDDMNAVESPQPKPTLANISQTPVQFDDIESAAARFVEVLTKSGLSDARSVSEKCHAGVAAEPTWSSADWCAAFDYAAAHVDAQISKAAGWSTMPYFQFQAANQEDRYTEAGASDLFVSTRLSSIKTAAESAVDQAMAREIAKEQGRRQTSPGTGASEGPASNASVTPGDEPHARPGAANRSDDDRSR